MRIIWRLKKYQINFKLIQIHIQFPEIPQKSSGYMQFHANYINTLKKKLDLICFQKSFIQGKDKEKHKP